ncbi:MAG: DnaJ domain-containing protein, partial [Rudaea sp.]
MIKDYYGILGVDPGARPEEIVEAFFRLTRKYHPLINPTPKARRRMREVAEAWEVLGDTRSRARYDRQRRAEMSFLHSAFEAFGSRIHFIPTIFRMGAGLMGSLWKTLLPVTIALAILAVVYTPVLLGARSYAAAQKIGSAGVVTAVSAKNIALAPTRTPARPVLSRVVISHETETAVAKRATVAESPAR